MGEDWGGWGRLSKSVDFEDKDLNNVKTINDMVEKKSWWERNQEMIIWMVGLLIIIALGLRGFGVI